MLRVMDTVLVFSILLFSLSIVLVGTQKLSNLQPARRNMLIGIILPSYFILLIAQLPSIWVSNSIVILASITGGLLIGSLNRSKNGVIVFVITAALVDFFSFSGGLTDG